MIEEPKKEEISGRRCMLLENNLYQRIIESAKVCNTFNEIANMAGIKYKTLMMLYYKGKSDKEKNPIFKKFRCEMFEIMKKKPQYSHLKELENRESYDSMIEKDSLIRRITKKVFGTAML